MKCDYCGSENAVISVYEYTAKGKKEKHLCLDCAIDKGLSLSPDDLENLTHNFIEQLVNFVPLLKKGKKDRVRLSVLNVEHL